MTPEKKAMIDFLCAFDILHSREELQNDSYFSLLQRVEELAQRAQESYLKRETLQ